MRAHRRHRFLRLRQGEQAWASTCREGCTAERALWLGALQLRHAVQAAVVSCTAAGVRSQLFSRLLALSDTLPWFKNCCRALRRDKRKHEGSGIKVLTTGQCDRTPILAQRFPADGAQGHCLTTHSFPLHRPRDLSHEVPNAAVQCCTAVDSGISTAVLLI